MSNPRTIKTKRPLSVILTACFFAALVFGFIVVAVWQSGTQIMDAKMSGIIIKKEFIPQAEEQIVLQSKGSITTRQKDGEYFLTVEVKGRDGSLKTFIVTLNKSQYDAVNVGDNYDVGPALVRE